ncbi:hypothetical protein CBL_10351 [Carabus blaptoides fortunei]
MSIISPAYAYHGDVITQKGQGRCRNITFTCQRVQAWIITNLDSENKVPVPVISTETILSSAKGNSHYVTIRWWSAKSPTSGKTICRQMFHVSVQGDATKTIARYGIDEAESTTNSTTTAGGGEWSDSRKFWSALSLLCEHVD